MPGPVYSYRWWDAPRRSIEWQQGRSLLLFATVAAVFPVGRASTELPPARVATPVAVGWQAPNNRVLQLQQPVTIKSARSAELPPPRVPKPVAVDWQQPFNRVLGLAQPVTIKSGQSTGLPVSAPSRAWIDQTQGRNFQLFQAASTPLPPGQALTGLPTPQTGSPGPALTFTAGGTPTPQTLSFLGAAWTDIPARAALFKPAQVSGPQTPASVPTAIRSGAAFELPPRAPPLGRAPLFYRIPNPAPPIAGDIRSAQWYDLPPPPLTFRQGATQASPLQPQVATPIPIGAGWTALPPSPTPFRAADVLSTVIPAVASIRSAQSVALPPPPLTFRQADTRSSPLQPPVLPALRSAQSSDLWPARPTFKEGAFVASPLQPPPITPVPVGFTFALPPPPKWFWPAAVYSTIIPPPPTPFTGKIFIICE